MKVAKNIDIYIATGSCPNALLKLADWYDIVIRITAIE